MSPATALLLGLCLSVLQFLASMLYFSYKIGVYKNKVDSIPEVDKKVSALHLRFDEFWKAMMSYENRLGRAEGELKRVNGKGGH